MSGLLGEIGRKLAERWAALLAVPGLAYLAAVTIAVMLGQARALSYPILSRKITLWAASPPLKSVGGTLLVVTAVLAGSVAAGLAAAAGGRFIEVLWTLRGARPPARWLANWRRRRSRRQKIIADTSIDPVAVRRAIQRADRICPVEPSRPTWIGDRLYACRVRIATVYGLDLGATWPRLWLIVPDVVRTEIGVAREAFSAAARLMAWALLYLALGIWWWPAITLAAVIGAAAISKGRLATADLADLIESAVDLHAAELAAKLGEQETSRVSPILGHQLTLRMRKDRWDPRSPLAD
jgi:hypothetical protein